MANLSNWLSNFSIVIQYGELLFENRMYFCNYIVLEKPWCFQCFVVNCLATKLRMNNPGHLCCCILNSTEKQTEMKNTGLKIPEKIKHKVRFQTITELTLDDRVLVLYFSVFNFTELHRFMHVQLSINLKIQCMCMLNSFHCW